MNKKLLQLFEVTLLAFRQPSAKQKDAYVRLLHTLCAACMIGAVSVTFTETKATPYVLSKIGALFIWGVLLFWVGIMFAKGE